MPRYGDQEGEWQCKHVAMKANPQNIIYEKQKTKMKPDNEKNLHISQVSAGLMM